MTTTATESVSDDWITERLPDEVAYGWVEERLILTLAGTMITIDWIERRLAPGMVTSPRLGSRSWEPADMAGRGWRDRLLAAAVEELRRMQVEDEGGEADA